MDSLRPKSINNHSTQVPFIHKDLSSCTHVWLRKEVRKALDPKYSGPYKVLERHEKYFKLKIGSREDTVSKDRLKPAFFEFLNTETCLPKKSKKSILFNIN